MIALDTNVLVRYVVEDDHRQAKAARHLIEAQCTVATPGFLTLVVVCELVWVLTQGYRYSRGQVSPLIRRLLAAQDLMVEQSDLAWQALKLYEEGPADFSDYVIGLRARDEKAAATYTFDRNAARSPLFRLVEGRA